MLNRKTIFRSMTVASMTMLSTIAFAVPKTNTTTLPDLAQILNEKHAEAVGESKEDIRNALGYLSGFTVYEDSEETSKYFFMPTFQPMENTYGAALINSRKIGFHDKLLKLSDDKYYASTTEMAKLKRAHDKIIEIQLKKKLDGALTEQIDAFKNELKKEIDELKLKIGDSEYLPETDKKAINLNMATYFGAAGVSVADADLNDAERLSKKMAEVSYSNGGTFTANVYAGLDQYAINYVRIYKKIRNYLGKQEIRIVKLPIETIEWVPIAEFEPKSGEVQSSGTMFRHISGGGNLSGATVNIDFTLTGASKFDMNPPPVVMPIYPKAKLTMAPPPFEATIKCDFKHGLSLDWQADTKDGAIVFNDDVFKKQITTQTNSTNTPCILEMKGGSGDPQSHEAAIRKAAQELSDKLSGLFFTRMVANDDELSKLENEFNADIEAHKAHANNNGSADWGFDINTGGFRLRGKVKARNFYWHTNKVRLEKMKSVKFEQKFIYAANEKISLDLASNICFAYNPSLNLYKGCHIMEQMQAKSLNSALQSVMDECTSINEMDCKEDRKKETPIHPVTQNATTETNLADLIEL